MRRLYEVTHVTDREINLIGESGAAKTILHRHVRNEIGILPKKGDIIEIILMNLNGNNTLYCIVGLA